MTPALVILALLGHGFLWAAFFNHTHATAIPRRIKVAQRTLGFALAAWIPVGFWLWMVRGGFTVFGAGESPLIVWLGRLYLAACWMAGIVALARWGRRQLAAPLPVLRHNCSRFVDLRRPAGRAARGGREHSMVARLPGNQVLRLEIAERALEVPRLAAPLDRLTIVHLSDLHLTGRVGKAYFDEAVRLCNQLEPDLVAITGDLVDRASCFDWIPDTLGRLTSRYGAYFVLGNHDLRIAPDRLRKSLTDAELVDLGGQWMEIEIRGERVLLAGNPAPWFPPPADFESVPRPPARDGGPLRIGLAHSPDQLQWARDNQVDLLLAGHTHGGQIRLPLVGPILSATHLGAAYSSGVFHVAPTIMHVSRGLSSQIPLRFFCPPEIARLVLRRSVNESSSTGFQPVRQGQDG